MYLTKLVLDPANHAARRDLASPYEMHRTLSRVFSLDPTTPPSKFLWRLEPSRYGNAPPTVLVQSSDTGNWATIQQQQGYLVARTSKPLLLEELIENERRYRFRLLANPTVSREGKRFGLTAEADIQDWLLRQLNKAGCRFESAEVSLKERWNIRKPGSGITLQVVRFDGQFIVENRQDLMTIMCNGIGHAKAFGLGMLSIAPHTRV